MPKQQDKSDNHRWQVLSTRAHAEDSFIYGVKTTGVYCVPGCSSRLPKRENVEFFDSCAQAKQAGFRASKRCEPDKAVDSMTETIERACRLIEESEGSITLKELASELGLSTFHLHRQFKKHVGMTPKKYATGKRRERLQSALKRSASVMEAIYEAGYQSPSRVYDDGAKLGLSPRTYRSGAKGTTINYAIAKCGLGLVLVATTDKGVCCIQLGDSRKALEQELQKRFPLAEITEDSRALSEQVAEIVKVVENPRAHRCSLPLDIQGTAFQMRVWDELRKIPAGSTATYSEIARRINQPEAVRAVASAIANNKLAVVIPCHRVIGKSGELTGYRWGVERKRQLLESEVRRK